VVWPDLVHEIDALRTKVAIEGAEEPLESLGAPLGESVERGGDRDRRDGLREPRPVGRVRGCGYAGDVGTSSVGSGHAPGCANTAGALSLYVASVYQVLLSRRQEIDSIS